MSDQLGFLGPELRAGASSLERDVCNAFRCLVCDRGGRISDFRAGSTPPRTVAPARSPAPIKKGLDSKMNAARSGFLSGVGRGATILFCLLCASFPGVAFAQSASGHDGAATAQPDPPPKTSAKTKTAAESNAAILRELEQMQARIAELEAQLKAQQNGDSATDSQAASAQPAPTATVSTAANAGASPAAATSASNLTQPDGTSPVSNSVSAGSASATSAAAGARAAAQPPIQESAQVAKTAEPKQPKSEPFAFADFTWLNGNLGPKETPGDTKFFTPEILADVDYIYDFNHPADDTIGGSSEVFRAQEFQVTQLGVGGDFHWDNVQARVMTQFGMYSATTPRNDASPARGSWDLDTAYRYISEAYGGYHVNWLHGVNFQAGIFMSYIGLFSYYNAQNWAYQPSYVSSNTPWFFNGMRVQIFPTEHLKIEPWFINGWQSYGRFNHRPGFGGQILWRPTGWLEVLGNQYAFGEDALGFPGRVRYHTDDSVEVKYYDHSDNFLDKMAFSLTGDAGCEHGGGVSCDTDSAKGPKQDFLGYMLYNRWWFHRDLFGFTLGGGKINNPGRYLVLLPPIDGATAITGSPYFTENPGQPFKAWDASATFDYMPSQFLIFRWEFDHREANVPYFTGPGGVTPPGGDNGNPGAFVCLAGYTYCNGSLTNTWYPDLVRDENRLDLALLVQF
jgi:Putative beta-barrel porin-2, OmpL-like. bbp2